MNTGMYRVTRLLLAITVFVALWEGSAAYAQGSRHRIDFRNAVVVSGNPILLLDSASLDYRYRLYETDKPWARNNYLGLGLQPVFSPAFTRMGAALQLAPLSFVRLGVSYEYVNFFGSFDHLQSFPGPAADYSDAELSRRSDEDENYGTNGWQLTASSLLQGRVGPVVLRDQLQLMRTNFDLRGEDSVFYEPVLDILMPRRGWAYTNDADVLYITNFGLIAGLRYTVTKAFYETDEDPNGPTHRLGPLVTYLFYQNPGKALDSATVFLITNWWLSHRYRTGEAVSQAIPYIAVGLTITGQLL